MHQQTTIWESLRRTAWLGSLRPTPWSAPGGGRELVRLALPLMLTNSIWTLQVTLDRILLSWQDMDNVGAAISGLFLFWAPLSLFQCTAAYATTFVAQYVGAGRSERVGPVVWQSIYFSIAGGLAFLVLVPFAEPLIALGCHSEHVQELEAAYFRCLCYSALPTLVVAATGSFFAGRGDSWTVLVINVAGLTVNGVLSYAWIFGAWGFPIWGIAGAGWATVWGTGASAALSLILLMRPMYRREFNTFEGWRFDGSLFRRLLNFGVPSGVQMSLDVLAWTGFLFLVGRLGDAELAASSIAFTLNNVAFMPALGIAQAVQVLVGQRLGQDQPDLAQRSTWTGLGLAWSFMTAVALLYVLIPEVFLRLFQSDGDADLALRVADLVPRLLRFVAVYTLFDSANLIFAFALRGAGDTRFVTLVSMGLAWPMMVVPTWAICEYGGNLYWAWTFASAYIVVLAWVFLGRFCAGRWKTMRVIENVNSTLAV